jgi:hypothetical protein
MKILRLIISSFVFALLVSFVVWSQSAPDSACTPDRAQELQTTADELYTTLATDTEFGDTWLASVTDLRQHLASAEAECSGLSFNSDTLGLAPVIGPIIFPDGLYRVTFTTSAFGIVDFQSIEGNCEGAMSFSTNLFLITQGQADKGTQTTFTTDGCTALITVSNTQTDWTMTFENLTN